MVLYKIGSRDSQLPKMIGAFLIVIAVLMLIQSGARMYDSWQVLKGFDDCVSKAADISTSVGDAQVQPALAQTVFELRYQDCKQSLYEITGAQIKGGETTIVPWSRTFFTAMINPIAMFFMWAIVFLIALFMFNSGEVIVPVEEAEIPLRPFHHRKRR